MGLRANVLARVKTSRAQAEQDLNPAPHAAENNPAQVGASQGEVGSRSTKGRGGLQRAMARAARALGKKLPQDYSFETSAPRDVHSLPMTTFAPPPPQSVHLDGYVLGVPQHSAPPAESRTSSDSAGSSLGAVTAQQGEAGPSLLVVHPESVPPQLHEAALSPTLSRQREREPSAPHSSPLPLAGEGLGERDAAPEQALYQAAAHALQTPVRPRTPSSTGSASPPTTDCDAGDPPLQAPAPIRPPRQPLLEVDIETEAEAEMSTPASSITVSPSKESVHSEAAAPAQAGPSRASLSRGESARRRSIELEEPTEIDPDLAEVLAEILADHAVPEQAAAAPGEEVVNPVEVDAVEAAPVPPPQPPAMPQAVVRILDEDRITPYARSKADALLATFPTTENPRPANAYVQKPSVEQLKILLGTAQPQDARTREDIYTCVTDILGHNPVVLHRLAKSLGVQDIPTSRLSNYAKLEFRSKATKNADIARRENNLKEGTIDKLLELRTASNTIIARRPEGAVAAEKALSIICKNAPLQLNHIVLNHSHGANGADVLGLLEAATGEELSHHDRMQAVCDAEHRLSVNTKSILLMSKQRGVNKILTGAALSGLAELPVSMILVTSTAVGAAAAPIVISTMCAPLIIIGAGFVASFASPHINRKRYQHKLEKDDLNVPRNYKFLNENNQGNLLNALAKEHAAFGQDQEFREANPDAGGAGAGVYMRNDVAPLEVSQISQAQFEKNLKKFMRPLPAGLEHIKGKDRDYLHALFDVIATGGPNSNRGLTCFRKKDPQFLGKAQQVIRHMAATAQYEHVHRVPKKHSKLAELVHIAESSCGACCDHAGVGLIKMYVRTEFDTTLRTDLSAQQKFERILQQAKHFGVMSDIETYISQVTTGMAAENSVKANMLAKDRYGLKSPFGNIKDFNYSEGMRINISAMDHVIATHSGTPEKFVDMLTANEDFRSFMRTHHADKLERVRVDGAEQADAWRHRLAALEDKVLAELTPEDGEEMQALNQKIAAHHGSPMAQVLPTVLAQYGMRLADFVPHVVAGQAGPSS
jgi:hypothetical protein